MTDYRTLSGAAFQREVLALDSGQVGRDAAMIAAEDLGYKIEHATGYDRCSPTPWRPRVGHRYG